MDPIKLSQQLIQCPSITPEEGGALQLLETWLTELGFTCTRLDHENVCNLHARLGTKGPHLAFAGHTDVVPLGDEAAWTVPPFKGLIKNDKLWGRGAADMKCAIACFVASLNDYLKNGTPAGSISLMITGDEEGPALYGTQKMLEWMEANDQIPHVCLIGEPACADTPGDQIKIGRRGSVTATLTCHGKQGHIAYPQKADNPVPRLVTTLYALTRQALDQETEHFQASNLEVTTIDVGNEATNIIPAKATAKFGVRFNNQHKGEHLAERLKEICAYHAGDHTLDVAVKGEAFLNDNEKSIDVISRAIETVNGTAPLLSTRGGTSDGRFIIKHCPVIECGMTEHTMHQVDEHVPLEHIEKLTKIYGQVLETFFQEERQTAVGAK